MKFEKGDTIRCINVWKVEPYLTYWRVYKVINVFRHNNENCVLIRDNLYNKHLFSETRFKISAGI